MSDLFAAGLCSTLLADAGARVMRAAIKPLRAGWSVRGRAQTVSVPAGDNLAIHAALAIAKPGDVLVVDAQGYADRAVMGGIMCAQAAATGVAGVVIDGAMRDAAELRQGDLPVFAAAVSPAGPYKAGGGSVNRPVQCGGVRVEPGDWILGDDDGLIVVGPAECETVVAAALAKAEAEARRMAAIARGELRPAWLDEALAKATLDIGPAR
ncbi:dimethylmenaquinone methyltransferase [Achromobacter arsenitoxydans]|uniref:Putative 4-hydroxy-4-methyl-2-oxoglutarate aldolase n=1 Tax=Achromobacter arsenitoxydans SY8 TaxID=477184 RepID=H0F719_9BURK|nr:dimethylmenaquinone methyltransferase [Achromobacter arsenitoxydans]EHK65933.1 dimethylmenaquinone methyltransferase [Achromobacter arsenitoxydans SY8]